MKDLSVIIVNWNSKEYIRECLKSVYLSCQEEPPNIIVVDGASFDGCDAMLTAEFSDVTYIQSQKNIGFGRCNNLGFEEVNTDYVLFLNPDTEVCGNALHVLLDFLKKHPESGIIGAKLLNTDGTLQTSSVQAFPRPLNQALDSNFLRRFFAHSDLFGTYALDLEIPSEVEAISGACMLMRSEIFREVGGFDPAYFMYAEDMDLSWRVNQMKRPNMYVPSAEIVHHGGGSSGGEFKKFSNLMMKSALSRFMKVRHGSSDAMLYRWLMGLSAIVRIICLIPRLLMDGLKGRCRAKVSIQRWWSTLRWALGLDRQLIKDFE